MGLVGRNNVEIDVSNLIVSESGHIICKDDYNISKINDWLDGKITDEELREMIK